MGVKSFKLACKFRSYFKISSGNTLSPSSFKESSLFFILPNDNTGDRDQDNPQEK